MTEATPGTITQRYFLPNGEVTEFRIDGNTEPEQIDNLVANAILLDSVALGLGLVPANQTAGAQAVSKAQAASIPGVREGNEVFKCVSIDISPTPDGRSKVEFFGNGFKQPRDEWAICSSLWTPDKLQELIAPYYEFQQDTFTQFGTFDVEFNVEYYFSKNTNQKGNPYKNVSKIHAIEGAAPPAKATKPAPAPAPETAQTAMEQPEDIPF